MEAASTPCAYLAVTEAESQDIDRLQKLNPAVFSYSPVETYFKLFPSVGPAVHQALKSRTLESAKAAVKPTTWFVLTLHFTEKQWLNLWMATEEPYIIWGPRRQAYRVYGTLDISEVTKDWGQMKIGAIGIDGWKDHALEKAICDPGGQCAECKVRDVKVYKSRQPCKKDWYCSQCWHNYIIKTFPATEQQDGEDEAN